MRNCRLNQSVYELLHICYNQNGITSERGEIGSALTLRAAKALEAPDFLAQGFR